MSDEIPRRVDAVMVLSNDASLRVARISNDLGLAIPRIGGRAFVRDTADARWLSETIEKHHLKESKDIGEIMIASKFVPFAQYAGIDTLLSLDAHWLFAPESFLSFAGIKRVFSLWMDDLKNFYSDIFVCKERAYQECLCHEKVHHFFSSEARLKEAEILGVPHRKLFKPAASYELLKKNHRCAHQDRLAFWGNPVEPPSEKAIQAFQKNESLEALRQVAQEEIFQNPSFLEIEKQDAQIKSFIKVTMEAKIKTPQASALDLLHQFGKEYPSSFELLQKNKKTLSMAVLIKTIFKYDMPFLVKKLFDRGWLDVYGENSRWEPYGVKARQLGAYSPVKSIDMLAFYQSYMGHFAMADATREETLNEKFFEIAASGRAAISVTNSDLASCFEENEEIFLVDFENLEEKISQWIQQSKKLTEAGEQARMKVEREHTWDHRMREILGEGRSNGKT